MTGARYLASRPFTYVAILLLVACAVGATWNLPCTDTWSHDDESPRASVLGAVFETWIPGHYFRRPPLHVLLLTILQSPIILVGVLRAPGSGLEAIQQELIQPVYMTPAAIIGRMLGVVMAFGCVWNMCRWWSRIGSPRIGIVAALLTVFNPIFIYFAHTSSLDNAYPFWAIWALFELDRVADGEPRERPALLLCTAAALTKDQAVFIVLGVAVLACVILPVAAAGPGRRFRELFRPRLVKATLLSAFIYLVASGALTNPSGFRRKLHYMTVSGNQDWIAYRRDWSGAVAQLEDIFSLVPTLNASWVVAAAAAVGMVIAAFSAGGTLRIRRLCPALAATTYLVLFVVPSRWTMDRHLMPLALLLMPYAGFLFDLAWKRTGPRWRMPLVGAAGLALAPQVIDVASVDGTLLRDARDQVRGFLAKLPPGTRVEVYGGNQFLPLLPPGLSVTRVGAEDFSERSPLPRVTELRARHLDVGSRDPEYLVVEEPYAALFLPRPGPVTNYQARLLSDPDRREFFHGLVAGSLGYSWALRARCTLPSPLTCRRIHFSTGGESWVFRKQPR